MDRCQFTYIALRDDMRCTAVGVEQAWEVLCAKLNRDGPGLPNGTHYFTVSPKGPELFAVVENDDHFDVYYHDCGRWFRYVTAYDVVFDTIPDTGDGCPPRATS